MARQPGAGFVAFTLDDEACQVLLTIGTAPENWPPWPWLDSGYNVEIEMQDSGDETRGGNALWLVMRDVERHDALAIVYQYDITRHRDVGPSDGIGFELVGPTCERADASGLLFHEYEMRVTTPTEASILRQAESKALTTSEGRLLRVETGGMKYTYGHLLPPDTEIADEHWGGDVTVVAWVEP